MSHQSPHLEKWLKRLKDTGNKVTKPRKILLECLDQATAPLSARDITKYTNDHKDLDSLDQVTVYRILETFKELGLVHQVFPSGDYLLCDHLGCQHGVHVMLRCSQCEQNKEIEIPKEVFAPMEWYLKQQMEFEPDKHLFQMNGLCHNCKGNGSV
jgi:Fe2+ or Zn2+ uptake regulation protein